MPSAVVFIADAGFVLSSTAIIMSVLQDRGEFASPKGQSSVEALLFEELMIMSLLGVARAGDVFHADYGPLGGIGCLLFMISCDE